MFTMQKQELILYPILFIEFIKFYTRFQLFSISTKLRVVRAIDNGICFDLFDTDDEHIPVHVLIPSKNTSTSTHYAGTTYNFGEETCNFDEGWKPRAFYGYLDVFGIRKNDYYALLMIYFIKYGIWCDSANNVYVFLVMYILNYSNYNYQLRYYSNTANKFYYQVRVIRFPLRFWNILAGYRMQFFSGMLCVHYRIQHRVPYLCNLVQIHYVYSSLNNNINDAIQYTYIDFGTINTACHTYTSTSTTGTPTYKGVHTSTGTECTRNTSTDTIICDFPCYCYCYYY